jgi:hypothetical protein
MKKENLFLLIGFILAFVPLVFLLFYIGIDISAQVVLSMIFPVLGLILSIYSFKKGASKGFSILAILANIISILVLLFLYL